MQKRNRTASALPITNGDTGLKGMSNARKRSGGSNSHRRPGGTRGGRQSKYGQDDSLCSPSLFVPFLILGGIVLIVFVVISLEEKEHQLEDVVEKLTHHEPGTNKVTLVETGDGGPLPLSHFESLRYPLFKANLVALYFAASWCPMSTPITELLDLKFGSTSGILLPPPEKAEADARHSEERYPLAIVHVSSDDTEEDMMSYMRPNWNAVPFDSPDTAALKRHFRVCAKPEMAKLGLERKYEIPSIIVIDAVTHGVLTTSGVAELQSLGKDAKAEDLVQQWGDLQALIRSMEDKYIDYD